MRLELTRVDPAQLAIRLGPWRPLDSAGPKEVDDEMKTARRHASHLVHGDRTQLAGPIACLFEELALRGVLETLVALHAPAGEEPRAGEWSGGLFHDEDPSGVIATRDDRADPRALPFGGRLPVAFGHASYGFFVGVGMGVRVGVTTGVRVGRGVAVGVGTGVGDGVGQGSGLTRFHVNRP